MGAQRRARVPAGATVIESTSAVFLAALGGKWLRRRIAPRHHGEEG